MSNQFENQVIVITGGTRGIGAGLSKAFLNQGAIVHASFARNTKAAQDFKSSLDPQQSERLFLHQFDVSKMSECESFFEKIDHIDVLINNGGIRKDNILASMSEDEWDQVLSINLKGSFNMSKHAVLKMMRKRYGRIINISSIGGVLGLSGQANYAASKAGQIAMSKSLAKEVAKRKITVNNIAPGFIETELISDLDEELVKSYKQTVPMKRFGSIDEVAHAALFLASKEASYITGTTIEVTGGL